MVTQETAAQAPLDVAAQCCAAGADSRALR
jgi:hypothetical protein